MIGYIRRLGDRRKLKKQQRYQRNKLDKIRSFADAHGVEEFPPFRFEHRTLAGRYLDLLKKSLIAERLTMLPEHKLDTLRYCIEDCLSRGIQGDIIETGVWRGGATIYCAGILKAHGAAGRKVFVADSFAGLPPPDASKWPEDKGDTSYRRTDLAVGLEEVRDHFDAYHLLDDSIVFVKGFFEESLRSADIGRLAVLRLDGDMYGSTMTVLEQLYHKLAVGGYLILDDWLIGGAHQALLDFRERLGIEDQLYQDFSGVFFRKSKGAGPAADGGR